MKTTRSSKRPMPTGVGSSDVLGGSIQTWVADGEINDEYHDMIFVEARHVEKVGSHTLLADGVKINTSLNIFQLRVATSDDIEFMWHPDAA